MKILHRISYAVLLDLGDVNLREANLREANLYEANLRGANLRGANLYGAELCRADLCRADLREADLREANLCGANLREADLRGADLHGVDLRGALGIYSIGTADYYEKFLWSNNGIAWINSGCRSFSLVDAINHWNNHLENRKITCFLLESAKLIADYNGWKQQ